MSPTTAEINLFVELDDDRLPTRIEWEATEAKDKGRTQCHSVMLSLWDGENKTVAAIDLWTKDTTIADINLHFYQAFHKMADTYLRATKNADMADLIHQFGNEFGASVGLE
ncbi:MAG: gliding motility protein GldC [Proteobacteria bacterium]|nr:gliding motility protein GldC [Pseudomonadota bacterium]